MQANDERQGGGPLQDLRGGCNLLTALVHAIAAPLTPWLRVFGTVGSRAWGLPMAVGLIAIVVLPVFLGVPGDPRPLIWFLLATVGLMLVHRLAVPWRERRGWVIHSRYTGFPWLCWHFSSLDEVKTKTGTEPILVFLAGFVVIGVGWMPLGVWMVIAAMCLLVSTGITEEQERARVRAIRDAMIEQGVFLDRLRERR